MNIFVDCHVFDGNLQGTTSYLKGLYNELIKDKTKTFYLASLNSKNLEKVFGTHTNIIYLTYSNKNKIYRLLYDIPKLIYNNKIDYAHFQYVVPPIKLCKYIVTIHDVLFIDYPKYFPFNYKISNNILFRISAIYADFVLTVSNYSKERIEHHFKINNVIVTPNAVDEEYFKDYDKNELKESAKSKFCIENYFLFVSRLEPRKNHLTLLKVFVENEFYKNYMLVFVGYKAIEDKSYNTFYNQLPATVKNKIITFSNINFDDLLIFVRAATLSIYPSIAEGFGIPPLESIAANVPTICSNSTAMSDFCFMEKYLFDPLDEQDLLLKINKCLKNQNHYLFDKLKNKYNWQFSASKINEILA